MSRWIDIDDDRNCYCGDHGEYENWNIDPDVLREAVERKRGQWIRNDNGTYSCSICHSWIPEEQHYYARYCLYCGARM